MSQPISHQPEASTAPPLQIVPRLQLAPRAGNGAGVGVVAGLGWRIGIVALIAAAAVAAPIVALTDHRDQARSSGRPVAQQRAVAQARAFVRGLPAAAVVQRLRADDESAAKPAAAAAAVAAPVQQGPLDLSVSELAQAVEPGSLAFAPPSYLVEDYRQVAQRYQISWRLLAAVNYIESGYGSALGAPEGVAVDGQGAVNSHALAYTASAAWQPSPTLIADATWLAADGAAQSPAQAVYTYTHSEWDVDEVLTVAQQIGAEGISASSGPMAKVVAMQTEARLLNGMSYVWGGGHQTPAWVVGSGFDCSGFVSAVLHAAGYLDGPQTTETLPLTADILKGPGKYVTIYDRTLAGTIAKTKKKTINAAATKNTTLGVHVNRTKHASLAIELPISTENPNVIESPAVMAKGNQADTTINEEHVIIDIDGQWWESGGDAADGGAEMVHRIASISPAYLKTFNLILHPSGM